MVRQKKIKTVKFDLLCGYIEEDGSAEKKEGESDDEFLRRTGTLHTECVVRSMDHNVDKDLANREVSAVDLLGRHLISVGSITDPVRLQREVAPKLLKGDYDLSLIRMRVISHLDREMYKFTVECPRNSCRHLSRQELDLDSLELLDMEDPWARRLVYTTEDDIELVFRHLEAADLDILADIVENQEDEIRQVFGLKFVSMDGVTPAKSLRARGRKCKSPEQHVREAIRMLDDREIDHEEREDVRRRLEKMVGYPKMIFKSKCPKCRATWRQRVKIDPSFFLASSDD